MKVDYKKIVNKYIDDVVKERILTCVYVKQMVNRHLQDLKRDDIYFCEDSANRFLKFSALCKYTKGELAKKGVTIEFTPQQVFRYWVLFGWKNLDGSRRFRKVYFELARKNGKSEEAAVVCCYGLIADKEFGAEIYTAGTKREQAKIVFDAAREMLRKLKQDSPKINELVSVSKYNCNVINTNSKLEPLASDSDKQDGLNPHFAAIDEYHAHKSSDLLEVIETGQGSRKQPLLLIITTAGFNRVSACYQLRKVATEILSGKKKDDSFMACIFTLDEGDDYNDPKNWIKSNPNLGITPRLEYLEQQHLKVKNEGKSKEVQFLTKNLNVWTDSSVAWIKSSDWELCGVDEFPGLKGRECYGGLDLASVSDNNSFVLVFPIDGKLYVKSFFWIPDETAKRKNEIADYLRWVDGGFVRTTYGQVIDQKVISRDILEIVKDYNLKSFAFDPYIAYNGVIQDLTDAGLNGFEHRQGFLSMSTPSKEFEKRVKQQEIVHDFNPCLSWQIGNVELEFDASDNIKPSKKKSAEKIDGVVAMIMAINTYMNLGRIDDSSPYDERGLIFI